MNKYHKEELLDALDCVTWYNCLAEEVAKWKDLPTYDDTGYITSPDSAWADAQLQVIWMIAVSLFGDYGTSPRSGWIEDVDGFKEFCDEITKTWREKPKEEDDGQG